MQKMAGSFININRASTCAVSPDLLHSEQLRGVTNVTKQFSDTIEKQTLVATHCYQEAINTGVPFGKQMTLTAENLLEKQQTTTDTLYFPEELVESVLNEKDTLNFTQELEEFVLNEKDYPGNDEERHIIDDVYVDLGKGGLSHLGDREKDTCNSKTFSKGPPTSKTFNEPECWSKAYEGVTFPEIPLTAVLAKHHPPVDVSVHTSTTVSLNQNDTNAFESKANTKDLHFERSSLAGEEMAGIHTNVSLGSELHVFDNAPENTCTFEEQSCILGPGDLKMSTRAPVEDKNDRRVNELLSNNACQVDTATVSGNIPDPFCLPNSSVPQDQTFHITGNSFSQTIRNRLPQTSEKPMSQTAGNHLSKPAGYPASQNAETDASPPFQASDISPYQAIRNPVSQSVGKHLSKTAGYSVFQEVENPLFADAGKQIQEPAGGNQFKTAESFTYQAIRNSVSQTVVYSPSQTAEYPMSQEVEEPLTQTARKLIPETVGNHPFQTANSPMCQALGNYGIPAEVIHLLQTAGKQMPETTDNTPFETVEIPRCRDAGSPVSHTAGNHLLLTTGYPMSQNVRNPLVRTTAKQMLVTAGHSPTQTAEVSAYQVAGYPTSQTDGTYLSQTVSYPISEEMGQPLSQTAGEIMGESTNPLFETAEYPVSQNTGDNVSLMNVDPVSSVLTQTTQNTFPQTKGNLYLQRMGNLLKPALNTQSQTPYNPASASSSPMSVCSDTSMSASQSLSAFKWFQSTPDAPDPSDKPYYTCCESVKKAIRAKIPASKRGQRYQPYTDIQPEATYQTSVPNLSTFKWSF